MEVVSHKPLQMVKLMLLYVQKCYNGIEPIVSTFPKLMVCRDKKNADVVPNIYLKLRFVRLFGDSMQCSYIVLFRLVEIRSGRNYSKNGVSR